MSRISLSIPNLNPNIADNLAECIHTNWIAGGGRFLTAFESNMASYVGAAGAVACQSGTGGIHASLHTLGVTPGTLVIAPTLTFIAAINPIVYLGAEPVFIDCDHSLNMDLDKLEQFLEEECSLLNSDPKVLVHTATGKRVSALVVVHVFGNLIDMHRVMQLSAQYGLPVMEDATEAVGSYYTQGPNAGKFAGTLAHLGVFSFNANKIITTAGGGMVVGQDPELLSKVRYLTTQAKDDMLYFVHNEIGYNYRMTNLQAALGVSQLDQLEDFITTKIGNYTQYKEGISDIEGLDLLPFNPGTRSNHWFYSLLIDAEKYGMTRDQLLHHLEGLDIETRPIWHLCHLQQPYSHCMAYKIEVAPYYLERVLSLPCSTSLTMEDVKRVLAALAKGI